MKKLILILVAGFLLVGNAHAEKIYLSCTAFNGLPDISIVFNDDTKTIIVNGNVVKSNEWNERIIRWGNYGKLDRVTSASGDHMCMVTAGPKF